MRSGIWTLGAQYREHVFQHFQRVGRHACAVPSVLGHHVVVTCDGKFASDSQVEVVIFTGATSFVEAANSLDHPAPIHHGAVHDDEVLAQHLRVGVCDVDFDCVGFYRDLSGLSCTIPSPDERAFRVGFETLHARLDRFWKQSVICVEENDLFATTQAQTGISGSCQAKIRLFERPDVLVFPEYFLRFVGGTVIDDDDFECRVILREYAIDGTTQEARLVVATDDNGHPDAVHVGLLASRVASAARSAAMPTASG